jgi:heptosyltransferase-3
MSDKIKNKVQKIKSLWLILPALKHAWTIAFAKTSRRKVVVSLVQHLGDNIAAEPLDAKIAELNVENYIIRFVGTPFSVIPEHNHHHQLLIKVSCLSEWIYTKFLLHFFWKIYDLHIHRSFCSKYRMKLNNPNRNGIGADNYLDFGCLLKVFSDQAGIAFENIRPHYNIGNEFLPDFVPANYIVLHAESNSELREWEAEKWDSLISFINSNWNLKVIEIGFNPKCSTSLPSYINGCRRLSINQIALLIKNAKLFIGIDSGFAHFANAFDAPRIILLGHLYHYDYYMPFSGPPSPKAQYLHHTAKVKYLPLEAVERAVRKELDTI